MDMGDRIQRAWRSFVRHKISAEGLRETIDDIDWDQHADGDTLYFYAVFDRLDGEPYVARFEGPEWPDYFQGAGGSELVVAVAVHAGMTKQDLLDFDAAEDSAWWEAPEWSDG